MNIDVEQFGLYLVVVVAGIALLWAVWPAVWPRKKKVEELKLDPVPEPVAVVQADPIPEPVKEEIPTVVETPAPVKKVAKKKPAAKVAPVKKPAAKTPAAPAKKAPAKKVTKK